MDNKITVDRTFLLAPAQQLWTSFKPIHTIFKPLSPKKEAITLSFADFCFFIERSSTKKYFLKNLVVSHNFGPTINPLSHPSYIDETWVIRYLNKIRKIHKSRDTLLELCWHQHFFTENQQVLVYQKIQV